ncbi:HET-domain-containing protein [Hypoxylon crocopeplum]|nr:HET-domain-containing protein [Hypoxylon crocopeplum]
MCEEIDKILNRKSGFRYSAIDASTQVRLLRLSPDRGRAREMEYILETVDLSDLSRIEYTALSYTWGHATCIDDIHEITIDGQPFFVRRNLFDFLSTALGKGKSDLLFIDAICINQLDSAERQAQVREMARVYRRASTVLAWLGIPEVDRERDDVRALSRANGSREGCADWTAAQWAGFRYLSYHPLLDACKLEVWCWYFTFPLSLFAGASSAQTALPELRFSKGGLPRTVVDGVSLSCNPAARIINHRTRLVLRPINDPLAQGTAIGTLDEMTLGLTRPYMKGETYQSQVPDLIHEVIRKFGGLQCSDPRDKLYGFLGILKDSSRAKVNPDYTKDINYAYRQALKIGLEEIGGEYWTWPYARRADNTYAICLAYYCDVREAFGMGDDESMSMWRDVVSELRCQTHITNPMADVERQHPLGWYDPDIKVYPDFEKMFQASLPHNYEVGPSRKFHEKRRRIIDRVCQRKLFPHR